MGDQERSRTTDAFIKIDGIDGESMDDKHKNEIEVLDFSAAVLNASSTATGGGSGAGVSQHEDFVITKHVDKASPKLFAACSSGEHIKKAVMSVRKAGKEQKDYLIVTLSDVLISGIQHTGALASASPTEEISFNYGKIEHEYKPQTSDGTTAGSIKAGYDVKARKPI